MICDLMMCVKELQPKARLPVPSSQTFICLTVYIYHYHEPL